ncbi:hypothetical protein CAOG_008507 [Capsaspora owczarzaki ATCC 30864]|uniref:Pescadillo homolog n=1 Tax=Capsaspora owczarzaki (strain ATCC 30864) TaxID=595528 RepID=A0A0D2VJ98_CAPO3|nr:hypothetical protein CAOG_008507 [Capsaspora owczarzaki ATCC 30864]
MKEKKKAESGAAINFISRNAALKKLQLKLADFRRLCILKGVYPREPRNKKKASGTGSTANKTYYLAKDIAFLAHEPILNKFREFKVFVRKLRKAIGRKEFDVADRVKAAKPVYTLDHIVRERYPSFVDALRDLDDALCMVFLFARMPRTNRIRSEVVDRCNRLAHEFESYIVRSRSLRKVFLSIKGIYYQAEVMGAPLTWLVPHQFSQKIPADVDFRIMLTFLEFHMTLLGFVNFRLYHSINVSYPPRLDETKDAGASGISALILEPLTADASAAATSSAMERIASLGKALSNIHEDADVDANENDATRMQIDESFAAADAGEDAQLIGQQVKEQKLLEASKRLFEPCRFYVSREVPRGVVELIIRSFGGQVSWDSSIAGGAPYDESDSGITHQIVDRPQRGPAIPGRRYVQPQWIFDCVNAHRLLDATLYSPGRALPPHLSPFVSESEGDYVPPEKRNLMTEEDEEHEEIEDDSADEDIDEDEDEEDEEEAEDDEDESPAPAKKAAKGAAAPKRVSAKRGHHEVEEDEDDEEAEYQRELEAESKGVAFSSAAAKPKSKGKKSQAAADEAKEQEELAKILMPKKHRRLYNRIMYSKNKKQEEVDKLHAKRLEYNAQQDQKAQNQAAKKAAKHAQKKSRQSE